MLTSFPHISALYRRQKEFPTTTLLKFFFFKHNIYLFGCVGSQQQHAGSRSLTRDETWDPALGAESQPLDNQRNPSTQVNGRQCQTTNQRAVAEYNQTPFSLVWQVIIRQQFVVQPLLVNDRHSQKRKGFFSLLHPVPHVSTPKTQNRTTPTLHPPQLP